jgi:NhaP-type Na+/H+ or K+/H+ antiporter
MMIIFSMIARNLFGNITEAYPVEWANYIRGCSVSLMLIRGGLQVTMKGNIHRFFLIGILPQTLEASVIAWTTYALIGYPVAVCYCIGYSLACTSPTIVIEILSGLSQDGTGRANGLMPTLIAVTFIDDMVCTLLFRISMLLSLNPGKEEMGLPTLTIG